MGGFGAGCRAGGIRQRWHPFDPPLCSNVDHRGRSSGFASRRLASRVCLLKGCGTLFVPHHHLERYCSEECVHAARIWRRWLADQKYRATEAGKRRRQEQSQRYRERRPEEAEPMSDPPRNGSRGRSQRRIRKKMLLPSAGMLRAVHASPAIAAPEVLQRRVLRGHADSSGPRETLAAEGVRHPSPAAWQQPITASFVCSR